MKRNIELKTRFADHEKAKAVLREIGAIEQPAMSQIDTYFVSKQGRLKLRQMPDRTELIWYTRPDEGKTRGSDYMVIPVADPDAMKSALERSNGIRGVVSKRREWFLWKNVRVHLDSVEQLGNFIEFEAVMHEGETESEGHARIAELCRRIGIKPEDYLTSSYSDLLGI